MHYQTKGTCAKEIHVEVDHGVIRSVEFVLAAPALPRPSAAFWWACGWRTRLHGSRESNAWTREPPARISWPWR